MTRRVAVLTPAETGGLHGLNGEFQWGVARTFGPADEDAVRAWAPETVVALSVPAPRGPWRAVAWDKSGPLPADDALVGLSSRPGDGVLVVGGDANARMASSAELEVRGHLVRNAEHLTRADLERAALVVIIGEPGEPPPAAAAAVLAAGRVLVAPRAEPPHGLVAGSDHLAYEDGSEMLSWADITQSFPDQFEVVRAMGSLAAEAHLASVVYGRLAVNAVLGI